MLTLVAPLAALAGLTLVITGVQDEATSGLVWNALDSVTTALTGGAIPKTGPSLKTALTDWVKFWFTVPGSANTALTDALTPPVPLGNTVAVALPDDARSSTWVAVIVTVMSWKAFAGAV
jgi:hypothetical protein